MKKVFVSAFALLASLSLWAQDVTTIYNEAAADYGAKNFASAAANAVLPLAVGPQMQISWFSIAHPLID